MIETLAASGGMFVIAGPPQSGKTTTIQHAITRLESQGWRRSSSSCAKRLHVFEDIDDVGALNAARIHAEAGDIVLVSMKYLVHLHGMGREGDHNFRSLKGVMCQRLLHKLCSKCISGVRCCGECIAALSDERVLVADVVELDYNKSPFDYRAFTKTDARFMRDAMQAVFELLTGIREVEREFGESTLRSYQKRNAAKMETLVGQLRSSR